MAGDVDARPRRTWRIALLTVIAIVLLEILLSLMWPHVVPRLALLPKPADESWSDGCNWQGRHYERIGPFWGSTVVNNLVFCPTGTRAKPTAFLRAPAVSTMPIGWTGPTWYQVHGPLALDAQNADTDSVPGGPYVGAAFSKADNATAVFIPAAPSNVDPMSAFRAMEGVLGRYGVVTQHAYQPVMIPADTSPGTGGRTATDSDVICGAAQATSGPPQMACVGRSDVIDVAQAAQRINNGT